MLSSLWSPYGHFVPDCSSTLVLNIYIFFIFSLSFAVSVPLRHKLIPLPPPHCPSPPPHRLQLAYIVPLSGNFVIILLPSDIIFYSFFQMSFISLIFSWTLDLFYQTGILTTFFYKTKPAYSEGTLHWCQFRFECG